MLSATCCFLLILGADANSFLRREVETGDVLSPEQERALLDEIESALGNDHRRATEVRLQRIEEALRPTFAALPRNEHGNLNGPAARYAMHRLFVERHGWFVRGIQPQGETWNTSSPASVLNERVPEHVQELFEKRLGGKGFELPDLAVLAATLEHLVHKESLERLQTTYKALQFPLDKAVSDADVTEAIDAYMAVYVIGVDISAMGAAEVRHEVAQAEKVYPTWPDTQAFLREVKQSVAPESGALTFDRVTAVVEEVGERYGRWQAAECRDLKSQLVMIEENGSGRVRLADFYGSALNDGNWQFSEAVDYLRTMGALDETDAATPRVIIPNYINSPSNCIAPSKYHAVCCLDECEELIVHIERAVAAPTATPAQLASMVANLSSATMPSNRTLSPSLLRRLDEAGKHHHGRIPLHGRLFSQWMHFAYPRECPYPHVSGTTNPQRQEDYFAQTNRSTSATKAEMKQHIAAAVAPSQQPGETDVEEDDCMSWTMEEELVAEHLFEAGRSGGGVMSQLRAVASLAALGATAIALVKSVMRARAGVTGDDKVEKYFV